jgi:exodeoxyribonuclease VII small subunit
MADKRDGKPSFEELYAKLEAAVEKLERGGLSLEDSIALYEEGMQLAKRCQTLLDSAEQRITKLRESFGQATSPAPAREEAPVAVESEPFDGDEGYPYEEE